MEQITNAINNIMGCLAKETANMDMLNSEEFKNACDGVKDLAMTDYYCTITKAMKDPSNVYGEDYDENGRIMRRGYNTRYGMNTRRGFDENMNDGGMPNSRRGYSQTEGMNGMYPTKHYMGNSMDEDSMMWSRYEDARRGYKEDGDMSSLNMIFDVIDDDIDEIKPMMSSADKQTAHQRLMSMASKLNV